MACGKYLHGKYQNIIGGLDEKSVFWCGEYYFDGEYNVVRFPEGMSLYHGSVGLTKNLSPYPVGLEFFGKASPPEFNTEESLAKQMADKNSSLIEPGWYGSFRTAMTYSQQTDGESKCGAKCLLAYKTSRPITIVLFNDPRNLLTLRSKSKNPTLFNMLLGKTFTEGGEGVYNPENTGFYDPLRELNYFSMNRYSHRDFDLPLAKEIRQILGGEYDGYGAPPMKIKDQKKDKFFHEELIFFNPYGFLERDIKNPRDLYYFPDTGILSVDNYLKSLSLFESANVNFHAGNLLEHSIWSLLWAERFAEFFTSFMNDTCPENEGSIKCRNEYPLKTEFLPKLISVMAFLHDLTKMVGHSEMLKNVTRKKFVYFSDKIHQKRNPLEFPIFDDNLEHIQNFSTLKLLRDMLPEFRNENARLQKIFGEDLLKYISENHLDLGIEVLTKNNGRNLETLLQEFCRKRLHPVYPRIFMLILIFVSWADIAGSQPFGVYVENGKRKPFDANIRSTNFPYLVNMTRVYQGGNADMNLNIFSQEYLKNIMRIALGQIDILASERGI